MTPEQKRIAIAEKCGWKEYCQDEAGFGWGVCLEFVNDECGGWRAMPDYLNDLNAMHCAEKYLKQNQLQDFAFHLNMGYDYEIVLQELFNWISTTAAQRADAFLLATGAATL